MNQIINSELSETLLDLNNKYRDSKSVECPK